MATLVRLRRPSQTRTRVVYKRQGLRPRLSPVTASRLKCGNQLVPTFLLTGQLFDADVAVGRFGGRAAVYL
jgi:hypothetical protein